MTGAELRDAIARAMEPWAQAKDELRELDAALGDGDLGITVSKGAAAVGSALTALDDDVTPADVLRGAASAFGSANPSTFAALTAGALLAAAKATGDATALDRATTVAAARAGAEALAARGKSELGDKTVLDALAPSVDALEGAEAEGAPEALEAMVAAARRGVDETAGLRSQRGRASWQQERSEGQPDPGATAYVRLLEAFRETWT